MACSYEAFLQLPAAHPGGELKAHRLGSIRRDFLAKNSEGAPVFLIAVPPDQTYFPSARYKYLSVDYKVSCRVNSDGESFEGTYVALSCDGSAVELFEMFVRVVAVGVAQFGDGATARDVDAYVISLQRLFRELDAPGSREAAGLWGELFVISVAEDCYAALSAWRSDDNDRFDFYCAAGPLEVKSTELSTRIHEFSLEQLEVPIGRKGYVASVMLQPISNGLGVIDLAMRIESRIQGRGELRDRLWRNVLISMGADFTRTLDRRFDEYYALQHLAIIPMHEVPAPDRPSDRRISSVRFRSDVSTVVSGNSVAAKGRLDAFFSSLLAAALDTVSE